jgi:hypothetical protein
LLWAKSNRNAGKDTPGLSGCQENIAEYAQLARQTAKNASLLAQMWAQIAKNAQF